MANDPPSSSYSIERKPELPPRPSRSEESPPPLPPRHPSDITACIADLPDYVYSPIKSSEAEIRVLTLEFDTVECDYGADLKGTLSTCFLPVPSLSRTKQVLNFTKLPVYEALSYVWGDVTRPDYIVIDHKKIRITSNLSRALRDMRKENWGHLKIWADAICINQGTDGEALKERSEQIMLSESLFLNFFKLTYHEACVVVKHNSGT